MRMLCRLFILLVIVNTPLFGAIIKVDNNNISIGDFTTLSAAHSSAVDGDTIYVRPTLTTYNGISVSKRLTFIGVGFELETYPEHASHITARITGTMTFNAGSAGSILNGFDGDGFHIIINENRISIKRNKIFNIIINESVDCLIFQNKLIGYGASNGHGIIRLNNSNSISIISNIIINNSTEYSSPRGIFGGSDLVITNNILITEQYPIISTYYSYVRNNIMISEIGCNFHHSLYQNNIHSIAGDNVDGNQYGVEPSTIFVDYENLDFHLADESPAIGAGYMGEDIGIYGGDAPYIDGGIPGIPSIFHFQADIIGSQNDGLNTSIGAKSHSE